VVTNLRDAPQALYETMYCARAEMENHIKKCQLGCSPTVRLPSVVAEPVQTATGFEMFGLSRFSFCEQLLRVWRPQGRQVGCFWGAPKTQ
jgi:hypothetical protein